MQDIYMSRSNYRRLINIPEYKSYIQGFEIGQDSLGKIIYSNYIDSYKLGFRSMISQEGERSLICAVLPRKTAHIHGVRGVAFRNTSDTMDMAGLCASIVMDFFIKTVGASNLMPSRMMAFPLGIDSKYNISMRSRTILLNSLTTHYSELWEEMWNDDYKKETWSITDARLKPFNTLSCQWKWETPLRNYFERRQALVEIDVIAAMALGLSLNDLEMIYTTQFPVLQQNEQDTWYDANGQIVFTCSKGLTGVGLDRKGTPKSGVLGWEDIRGKAITDEHGNIIGYQGITPTYTHTINPTKSELYGGQKQTFVAPYTKCDRIEDYRTAWVHFEKIFNK